MTVIFLPAMVTVPLRAELVKLALIERLAVPFPVSLAPSVMVSHDALLFAVQEQVGWVVTSRNTSCSPAERALPTLELSTVKLHTPAD